MKLSKISSKKCQLSSCDVTIAHTGTLSHDQAYLGNVVNLYTLRTRSIDMVWCRNYRVPIEVPLFMQPNFDILFLCVY